MAAALCVLSAVIVELYFVLSDWLYHSCVYTGNHGKKKAKSNMKCCYALKRRDVRSIIILNGHKNICFEKM